jgi:two-component system NtrC family response regulator
MSAQILIVEDDASFARIVQLALKGEGHRVDVVGDAESAKKKLSAGSYEIVVTDLKLPGASGVELLDWISATISPMPAVFIMTAFATVGTAVEAMKKGAADYLTKPFSNDELVLAVRKALRLRDLENENRELREALVSSARFENIIGNSRPMQELFELMRKASTRDFNVLIRGESGTGKELIARAIHFAGPRRNGPFVPVDSAAIPETLLESELFGHIKGSFTGALRDNKGKVRSAHGGTLFLDEIGDMQPELQAKLLRVLQEREVTPIGSQKAEAVDVRVIAATHVDLEAAIREGRFREDLYFRLNVLAIRVPPLRERKEDIPVLVRHFIGLHRSEGASDAVSEEAMSALMAHDWPGNVRELQNAIEHALVVADGVEIRAEHLPESVRSRAGSSSGRTLLLPEDGIELERLERELIEQALERTGGNQTRAAQLLGITRPTLIYRMEKHGIGK